MAIDPAPFRGVLPLPISALKARLPVLRNPLNRKRAVPLTFEQFRYAFANAVSEDEAKAPLRHVRGGRAGRAGLPGRRRQPQPVDRGQGRHEEPGSGPLLIIAASDNTVPWAIAKATYERQKTKPGVTEIVEITGRGHSLTIDNGWREVADTALDFVQRFVSPPPAA